MLKVGILMGSKSDLPVVKDCYETLKKFGVPFEVHIMSAHRSPALVTAFASAAKQNGFGVIIAAAGKAAHLAGVVAGHTALPVIGLPIKSSTMDGLDSLLSTVQMPAGIPVATVAINGAVNAGLLAVQMLSLADADLAAKMAAYKKDMADAMAKADAEFTID